MFVCDPSNREVAFLERDEPIAANSTCVTVITMHPIDGETTLVLAQDEPDELLPGADPDFSGWIETPMHRVVLQGVYLDEYLVADVPNEQTKVRIWLSDNRFPDWIVVAVGEK
jgi:hypothetical protein